MSKCKFCGSYDGMSLNEKPFLPNKESFGFICRVCGKVTLEEPK